MSNLILPGGLNGADKDKGKDYVQKACEAVAKELPDGHGFILFTFPFLGQGDGMMRYASSAGRQDAINAICEWLSHQGVLTAQQGNPWNFAGEIQESEKGEPTEGD